MAPSDNPYESPRVPETMEPHASPVIGRHGWKFVLLGIAIACGIISVAPWLGVIFAMLSAPVFMRHYVYGWKRPDVTSWEYATSQAAGFLGAVGFAISVVAAAGGAFFGICSATSWSIALPSLAANHNADGIGFAILAGIVAGIAAGLTSLLWLIHFYYDSPPSP